MNFANFKKKYRFFKDSDIIEINCEHYLHLSHSCSLVCRVTKVAAKRNISKKEKEKYICKRCALAFMPKSKTKQIDEIIDVICQCCGKVRQIKKSSYFGKLTKGKYYRKCGECTQLGKEISEEQREKIRKSLTGRKISEETKKKISKHMRSDSVSAIRSRRNLIPIISGCIGWNKGLTTPKSVRDKISKSNKGRKFTEEHCKNISIGRKIMLKKQGGILPETREKISLSVCKACIRGFKYKKGYYVSKKMNRVFHYNSKNELVVFILLDKDPNVVSYEYESTIIPYYKPGNNYKSSYIVDFLITFAEGKKLVEVKPAKLMGMFFNEAKMEAAQKYSENLGVPYEIWTESIIINLEKKIRVCNES